MTFAYVSARPRQVQTLKTAVKAARMLLHVDDVVQAIRRKKGDEGFQQVPEEIQQE